MKLLSRPYFRQHYHLAISQFGNVTKLEHRQNEVLLLIFSLVVKRRLAPFCKMAKCFHTTFKAYVKPVAKEDQEDPKVNTLTNYYLRAKGCRINLNDYFLLTCRYQANNIIFVTRKIFITHFAAQQQASWSVAPVSPAFNIVIND